MESQPGYNLLPNQKQQFEQGWESSLKNVHTIHPH